MITVVDILSDLIIEEVSDPSYDFNLTIDGSSTILIVAISVYGTTTIETINWNGVPMTIDLHKNNLNTECVIAHLLNPDTGKLDLTVSISGDSSSVKVGVLTATGVSESNPINKTAFFNTEVAEGHSLDITTSQNGCLIVDCLQSGAVTSLSGDEEVIYINENTNAAGSQYYLQTSAGNKTMAWTWGGEDTTTHMLVAFQPVITEVLNKDNFPLNLKIDNSSLKMNVSKSSEQNLKVKNNNLNLKL